MRLSRTELTVEMMHEVEGGVLDMEIKMSLVSGLEMKLDCYRDERAAGGRIYRAAFPAYPTVKPALGSSPEQAIGVLMMTNRKLLADAAALDFKFDL
jgi:hypothetical protein